jgi:hypothetical protein
MAYENVNATPNFQRQVLGQKGFRFLDSAGTNFTPVGEFTRAFTALEQCTLTLTAESGDNLSSVTVPAGVTIYGLWSQLAITTGKAIVYIA